MTLDEYRHLWDGSEPGWTLHRFDRTVWRITFSFASNGPSQSDIIALRKLLASLCSKPISQVLAQLRGQAAYELPNELGNIEMRNLMDTARELGLQPNAESIDRGGYLPVHFRRQRHDYRGRCRIRTCRRANAGCWCACN